MGKTIIKILFLEDDPGDARLLQMMLDQAAPGEFALSLVPRLGDALTLLGKGSFDMILSDLDVPDSKGLGTFLQFCSRSPGIPIIVLSGLADESVAMQAVQKGAQDYLIKGQANGTQIARALRHALERHRRSKDSGSSARKARLLAFVGAKGGVGTTTVALNVAAALARQKQRVTLVELTPYFGGLAMLLRRTAPPANLRQVLKLAPAEFNQREISRLLCMAAPNLRVLFGPQTPAEFGEIDPGQAISLVDELAGQADYVVADLPFVPSAASEALIRRSSYVAMVVERDAISIAAGKTLLQVLGGWSVDKERVGAVLVNRVAVAHPLPLGEVRSGLGCELIGIVPPAAETLALAQHAATPLVAHQTQEIAATALTEIAARLAQDPVPAVRIA